MMTTCGHHGEEAPRCKSEPSVTRRVQGSFRVADEACLQGYNFGFNMYKFIMRGRYPEVGEAIRLLISRNAKLEEIVNAIKQRK